MPSEQLRYDRHTQRLFLSERVPLLERPFLVARQIAFLGHRPLFDRLAAEAGMAEPEAARICRNGFARRLAEAILAPGERLAAAARESGFDIALLSRRFALQPSRIAQRLAALGAEGAHGLPPGLPRDARSFGRGDRQNRRRRLPAPAAGAALRAAADFRSGAFGSSRLCRARARRWQHLSRHRFCRGGRAVRAAAAAAPADADRLAQRRHRRSARGAARAGATGGRHLPALRAARLRPPAHPAGRAAERLPRTRRRTLRPRTRRVEAPPTGP